MGPQWDGNGEAGTEGTERDGPRPGEPAALPAPPPEGYGYFDGALVPSTRDGLVERIHRGQPTPLVWTPETGGLVRPWHVPWLFEPLRARVVAGARKRVLVPAVVFAALLATTLSGGALRLGTMPVFLVGLAGIWLLAALHALVTARRLTPGSFETAAAQRPPVQARTAAVPTPFTNVLSGILLAVGAVQVLRFEPSLVAGALDPDAVAAGQGWRLLTAAVLHGNVLHFAFNFMALRDLGRLVETYAHRPLLPLVFLLAALGGNVASLALPPESVSVGASGGLLGLVGFLGILGWRRRDLVPAGFLNMILIDIGLIAFMGILGYAFIDNAAHAGGLATGALVGLAVIPLPGRAPRWQPGRWVRLAGVAALGMVAAAGLLVMLLALAAPGALPGR